MKIYSCLSLLFSIAATAFAQAPTVGKCTVLPADNIWNTPVDQLPVHPNSATWVSTIALSATVHADFGSGTWAGAPIGIPFITVPGTQTKYPATFMYQSESDPGPYAVPLDAPIEGGSSSTDDRHVIAVDTDNCILYEMYSAYPQTASWQGGSGAIYNLRSNALRPAGWTSADAAGLPIFPGLVRYDELAAGAIRHAIRVTAPQTQQAWVWPARHFASPLTSPQYPPMGARFRLKASFDISGFSPANQIILTALKRYGMILADNGAPWFISGAPDPRFDNNDLHALGTITGAAFEAVDVSPLMVNPDSGQVKTTSVNVTVTPPSASVLAKAQQQLTATVSGTANPLVTWDVNGVPGGNGTVGLVNSSGLYTAPSVAPSPAIVTVHAVSQAAPAAVGSAQLTIVNPAPPVSVMISPASATVRIGRTEQFTAAVQNTTNTGVTWNVNGIRGGNTTVGQISSTGLYRAPAAVPSPADVIITAVSKADYTRSASAAVTITRR